MARAMAMCSFALAGTLTVGTVGTVGAAGAAVPTTESASAAAVRQADGPGIASTLTKSVQDVTSPGANPVNHGDVLNWVINYTNDSGDAPTPVTITDPIGGAGTAQTYVPGSLKVPPDWTRSWSTDGTNFQPADPGTAARAVRASNNGVRGGGTSSARILLQPVQTSATATGGDGFTPVIYRTAAGGVQVWNMYHHLGAPLPKLVCSDLITAQLCAGGPWPKPINTTPGPFGSGSTGDIATPSFQQYVFDPARPGILYYAGITATQLGVGCLDLEAHANCGFFPLQNIGGSPVSANSNAGFVQVGGNIYGVSTTGQVLCWVMSSRTPCAGQPYAAIVPPNASAPGSGGLYVGSMTVAAGKVFASSSPSGGVPEMGCFDPATNAECAGWGGAHPLGPAGSLTRSEYTAFNTAGAQVGACSNVTGSPSLITCYTIGGAPLAAPTGFALPAGAVLTDPKTITAPNGHLQSYMPTWGGSGPPGATFCYDWTNAAPCAGFPVPATHPSAGGGNTRDYGYDYDEPTQCLFGLGDAGLLFSIDPTTGATPCIHSGAQVTLNPGDFYCDGGASHIQGYDKVRLEGMNVANIDLPASRAVVTAPDGSTIATLSFAPDGTIDLSGISSVTHPSITVTASLVLLNTNDFTGGNQPHLVVSFTGDAPQICFQTTVTGTCTVTNLSNTATGTDATGTFTTNTVNVAIAPGATCQPRVSVNKEICQDLQPVPCGPGGAGPWGKQTMPGLLGILGIAYWRITVTNDGPVDATQVRLNDPGERDCENAAGTFDLPANTSRQFFCDTLILLLPFTNTVRASYLPANSPAGTPRSTTAPSSATACAIILCGIVGGQDTMHSKAATPVRPQGRLSQY